MKYLSNLKVLITVFSSINFLNAAAISTDDIIFSGNLSPVISLTPNLSSGLNNIFVFRDANTLTLSYRFNPTHNVAWYIFDYRGSEYAERISDFNIEGNLYIINNAKSDCGYLIEDNNQVYFFWIINYNNFKFLPESIILSPRSDCNTTVLDFSGTASPINYYGINGKRYDIDRGIKLIYSTSIWNDSSHSFIQEQNTKILKDITGSISIIPPVYSTTSFVIEGDRFSEEWEIGRSVSSPVYSPISITAKTNIIQEKEIPENSNQITTEHNVLGGNAPCELTFEVVTSEGVIHDEWQFASDPDFNNLIYRINEKTFNYTFLDEGKTYVRYIGSNSDGSCETISETYEIEIGASELLVPNVFSPNNDGINDEWKVSYRSIIEYECWIYDRYGKEVFHSNDPEKGWNGKNHNRSINSGVYYYIIKAHGSDGKTYNLSGDINIIKRKNRSSIGEQDS